MSLANGNFGGGDGTKENPFLIEDAEDLVAVQNSKIPFSKPLEEPCYLRVVNDIDMKGIPWDDHLYYSNHFDGGGHTISNLVLDASFTGTFQWSLNNITFDNLIANINFHNSGANSTTCYMDNVTINAITKSYYYEHPFNPQWNNWSLSLTLFSYLTRFHISNVNINLIATTDGVDGTLPLDISGGVFGTIYDCSFDNVRTNVYVSDSPNSTEVNSWGTSGFVDNANNCEFKYCYAELSVFDQAIGFSRALRNCNLYHCRTLITNRGFVNSWGQNTTVYGFAYEINESHLNFCSAESFGGFNGTAFTESIRDSYVMDCFGVVEEVIGSGSGFVRYVEGDSVILRCYALGALTYDQFKSNHTPDTAGFAMQVTPEVIVENCISIIRSITAITNGPPNWYRRFSFNKEIANVNYVLDDMQFIDERDLEGVDPEWIDPIPFDDGIPIPDATLKTQAFYESLGFEFGRGKWIIDEGESYPRHDYSEAIPVYKCKTFYLN